MSGHTRRPGILGRKRLEFDDNDALEQYYEDKYSQGGYEGEGCCIRGIDVSRLYHQARHRSALALLGHQPHDTILDAGCGDGSLSKPLAANCRLVCAVDIAGNAMDASVRALPNVMFRKMNIERLDYPDCHFDRIVCVETLEHLLDPLAALAEFARALAPNGRLVITYPTVNQTTIRRLQARVGLGRPLDISEHLTEWSCDELIDHVEAAGFELVACEGIAFDFGLIGRLKYTSGVIAREMTRLALAITRFPRNSSFVSTAFRRTGRARQPR